MSDPDAMYYRLHDLEEKIAKLDFALHLIAYPKRRKRGTKAETVARTALAGGDLSHFLPECP